MAKINTIRIDDTLYTLSDPGSVQFEKQELTQQQKDQVWENLGLGNVAEALDEILAIQNTLMGGDGA